MTRRRAKQPEQRFSVDRTRARILRRTTLTSGRQVVSSVAIGDRRLLNGDLSASYDRYWLDLKKPPRFHAAGDPVNILDLFSGCGAMTLGALEAARALGMRAGRIVGADQDPCAAAVFRANFDGATTVSRPLEEVFQEPGSTTSSRERALLRELGGCDLLLGGPPCQGHSDLNNHTRRADPRNRLMIVMLRAAEVLKPLHIIIENVRGIQHDRGRVAERVADGIRRLGYSVDEGILRLEDIGVPQRRRRYLLVASRVKQVELDGMVEALRAPRSFGWACRWMRPDGTMLTQPSVMSEQNQKRVAVLFRNSLYDLPNEHRPRCHRNGGHSYKSAYGRLRWDEPAQTITTGFGSMGQGRFVHPRKPRTLTPREAARLQFIPNFFDFVHGTRTDVARMIGNAVPPRLSYVLSLALLC